MSFVSRGPSITLSAAEVDMLWRAAGLDKVRVRRRLGDDPVYRLLVHMHQVRLAQETNAVDGPERRHPTAFEDRVFWTIRQLGKATGRAERTIRKDIAAGELAATKPARAWIITAADAAAYIDSRKRTP